MTGIIDRREGFALSFDAALLDPVEVHATLRTMYWCREIPLEIVRRSIANSIVAAVYDTTTSAAPFTSVPGRLAAFARIISDRATFAYLCDVFVVESPVSYRGRGLSVWMVERLRQHPDLQGLRRWCLLTRDAHTLYERFGFGYLEDPRRYMEVSVPNLYGSVIRDGHTGGRMGGPTGGPTGGPVA